MVARFAGATLGLLAFTITAFAGLYVQNPVSVTLSRSVLALFLFFFIGLALGSAAELVIREYEEGREEEIRKRFRQVPQEHHEESTGPDDTEVETSPNEAEGAPVGT